LNTNYINNGKHGNREALAERSGARKHGKFIIQQALRAI